VNQAGAVGPAATPPADPRAELRRLSNQLQGVFIAQLFQAMRQSVPEDGLLATAPGGDLFNTLLDDRLATQTAERLRRGIGEALYRELVQKLPDADASPHGGRTHAVEPGSR
jgi:Rod binding domain-containing protein